MNTRSLRSENKSARYMRDEVRRMKHNITQVRKWEKQWVIVCPGTSLKLHKWVPVRDSYTVEKKRIKISVEQTQESKISANESEVYDAESSTQQLEEMSVDQKEDLMELSPASEVLSEETASNQ